jgi:chemosensory pili system protein ChpA (sensor histidine kinase/response regulator)
MDVVRDAIEQLHGSVDVISHPGKGTSFVLSMPITVAQLPVLMVTFGTQQFAVPMHDITRVFRLSGKDSKQDEYAFEDETVPLLHPARILRLNNSKVSSANVTNSKETNPLAIAIDVGGRHGVLVTDTIVGKSDVIFKNLGSHLRNVPCIAGATIMGDGTLVPILQTEDLFSRAEMSSQIHDDNAIIESDRTITVLIVDDSISIRKVLTNFINNQGWDPLTAHDGMDAMEKIRESKPDLVLLDIEMPRMNGFEVLQSLQLQSAYRDIPVVMLTSRSASKYRDKATRLGARGFVTKPFRDEDVISLITSLTGKTVKG